MVSLEEQEKLVFLNSQYGDNKELIQRLQTKLLEEVTTLDLSTKDLQDTKDYLQDKVTLFRFLRESNFDFDKAHEELLKTIAWRIELHIADLTYKDSIEFFDTTHGAFAFFHKTDKIGRPLLFVRLRYFPKSFQDPNKRLIDHIQPFACLIMEMSRKLTWDMTCDTSSLVSQMTVVVNIEKAPIIPVDAEIIKMIGLILEARFPGMVSSVNILNFGWMYQGIWTVVKYLLSEEAKESIQFTTVLKLNPLISSDSILQEMGGDDNYQWSFSTDTVLEKYGSGIVLEKSLEPGDLPNTPPLSEEEKEDDEILTRPPLTEERNSLSSTSSNSSDDIFFDANDSLSIIPSTPSTPSTQPLPPPPPSLPPLQTQKRKQSTNIPRTTHATPPLLTSPSSVLPGSTINNSSSPTNYYGNLSTWVGLRMGVDFLTSFIDTKGGGRHQRQKKIEATIDNIHQKHNLVLQNTNDNNDDDRSVIVVNDATSVPINTALPATTASGYQLQQAQLYLKRFTHRILQLSFGQHGMVCWVLLYFFLRGPVESFVQKSLLRTSWVGPQRIKSTTIGITAAVSAVVSSSISNTIERSFKNKKL